MKGSLPTLEQLLPGMSPSMLRLNPQLARGGTSLAPAAHPDDRATIEAREKRSSTNRARAREAQKVGAALENILDEHHGRAIATGLADLEHQHPRVYRTRDGLLHYGDKSGPDYRGVARGGLALAIEAKSAGKGRLGLQEPVEGDPARDRFDGVKDHQAAALTRCERLGGIALLVVRFVRMVDGRPVATLYAIPWGEIADLTDIGPDDVAPWAVTGDCYLTRFIGRTGP